MCYYHRCDNFPQDHYLISPRRTGVVHVHRHVRIQSIGDFFSSGQEAWLWNILAQPVAEAQFDQTYIRTFSVRRANIEALPVELLDMVIDQLWDRKEDVLALGLSSAHIWQVVLDRIHRGYRTTAASWAGERISFQGGNSTDSPSAYDENNLKGIVNDVHGWKFLYQGSKSGFETNFCVQEHPMDFEWMEVTMNQQISSWHGVNERDWDQIRNDLRCAYMFPQDRIWVLRNLRAQEFVRSDQLRPDPRTSQRFHRINDLARKCGIAKDVPPVTFGQVFLLLTSFSTNVSRAFNPLRAQNGQWAGDYFDIVPLDAFSGEANGWRDVSEAAVNDVASLRYWGSKLPPEVDSVRRTGYLSKLIRIELGRAKWHNW